MIRRAIQRLLLWFLYAPPKPERAPVNAGLLLQVVVIGVLAILLALSTSAGASK